MNTAEATRVIFEQVWNRGDFDNAGKVLAGQFRLHVGGESWMTYVNELRVIVDRWHPAFEGFHFQIHTLVASDDTTAMHATLRGTQRGVWLGIEPTGAVIAVEHMFFLRFEDDKAVEVWELLDRGELLRQLAGG